MSKYTMVPVGVVLPITHIETEEATFPVVKLEPTPTTRYIITVEVGDAGPIQVHDIMKQANKILSKILVKDTFVIVASRNGTPTLQVYELQPEEAKPPQSQG